MFRLWGKMCTRNKLIRDIVIEDDSDASRVDKIENALSAICRDFDLQFPMWLDTNYDDFSKRSKTRFYADNFIESIDFDYLEIVVIEEDDDYSDNDIEIVYI